jgi:hypothetical protein
VTRSDPPPPTQLPPDDDADPFWIRIRSGLCASAPADSVHGDPAPCDPARLARKLLQRRQWEIDAGRRRWRVIQFAGVAVAAACAGIVVGWQFGPERAAAAPTTVAVATDPVAPGQPSAWFEDGGPVMAPSQDVGWASYMPRGQTRDLNQATNATDRPHPWLGIWTRPVQQIDASGGSHSAHLVVRVAGGSPAWTAGLRPGDILTALDGCSLATPECIGAHLSSLAPGSVIQVTWWDGHAGRSRSAPITLDAIHE